MTTSTPQQTDPRPLYRDALGWVRGLVDAVPADRYGDPTPCTDFDVRTLVAHLAATVGRVYAVSIGESALSRPALIEGIPDEDLAATFGRAVDDLDPLWDNDELLDSTVTVPWGEVPGRGAVWGYLNEALVHGWDLAVATGQDAEADPALAEATFAVIVTFLPAQPRGGPVPFGQVVEPAADAGPTERLANWAGRRR
ncbi:TIGR03086 family metal-binding protein [Pseudonocardia benzenivorans]|uniref:TIGR03086 family metal-binding protein n=1 Tax=Pseudonocardia benzenivorans TaxID=228005 RepID=A0ABW3VMB9_9PSEU